MLAALQMTVFVRGYPHLLAELYKHLPRKPIGSQNFGDSRDVAPFISWLANIEKVEVIVLGPSASLRKSVSWSQNKPLNWLFLQA